MVASGGLCYCYSVGPAACVSCHVATTLSGVEVWAVCFVGCSLRPRGLFWLLLLDSSLLGIAYFVRKDGQGFSDVVSLINHMSVTCSVCAA